MATNPGDDRRTDNWTIFWYVLYFTGFFGTLWLIAAFGLI